MKKNGKYCSKKRTGMKPLAILLALTLLLGCAVGGTLAWLTADGGTLTNTFTESDIDITLTETKPTNKTAPMVPGWTIDKDPKVTVTEPSEDCWLFVKITESTNPDLDTYISYAIASGWESVDDKDNNEDTIVIGRKVYKGEGKNGFDIIGYTDTMGTTGTDDDVFVPNKVLVKEDVDKTKMGAITGDNTPKPTLTFNAYAVQLFKTNSDGKKDVTTDEFTMSEAWAKAAAMG